MREKEPGGGWFDCFNGVMFLFIPLKEMYNSPVS